MVIKMTSVEMRNHALFKRNEYDTTGRWQIPIIRRQEIDLKDLDLIAYSDIRSNDNESNCKKGVHFFIDDYRFEGIYRNPQKSLSRLSQYRFLLTPDYSTYSDMNLWRQMESVAHSRWVGAFWQSNGLAVIPTVCWSDARSYNFCFDGIEENAIIAIGMIGCKKNRIDFMRGYQAMLEKIRPSAIICFGKPFDDMKGNVIVVDYLSTRRVVR